MKKAITFLLLIVYIILLLSACNQSTDISSTSSLQQTQVDKSASDTIRLLYSSKDSLDPYICVTEQNADLAQLIFEPLLIVNNNYEIENRLAKSVNLVDTICTINLINAKFSDGSNVTAEDVVFSFNKAKKSVTTRHANALKYATSAIAENSSTVKITLKRKDPYFINLLTFPILKKGSDELKDTDNQALVPIGAGQYVFDNQTATLTQNQYFYGKKSVIKKIITVDCPDNESVNQAITAGMVDHYFSDLSENSIPKMNGNTVSVPQNRIVFLGINSKQPQLSNSLFRQAISSAISRNEICSSAYYNNATPALGPFPSLWKPTEGLLTIQSDFNTEIAKNNIELAGFTKKNKDGFYLLKNNNPITFSLLVNSSNNSRVLAANIIAKRLANVGIKINVNSVSNNKYYSLLRANQFDLYLGEIRYEDNMDIQGLISLNSASALLPNANQSNIVSTSSNIKNEASTSSSFTNSSNQASVEEILNPGEITLTSLEAYKGFYNGDYNLKDLITVFNAELPIIPICFKNGMVIYSDRFGNGISPSTTELFHGIQYLK